MVGRLRFAGVSGGRGQEAALPLRPLLPGPVPGGIAASAEKPVVPKTGSGKAEVPRRALRVPPARPQPVPGRPRRPVTTCGCLWPARNRFRAGGFQKRGNQRRPQPVPGGKTVPKPTPVARITFNREITGARNRFWAPGRPDARTPRPAARARPKKAGAGRRVRHPAPTPVNLPALVKPPATGSSSPRPGRSGPGRRRRGWRSPPCPRSPRRACCPWCRRGRRRPRPRRAPSRG